MQKNEFYSRCSISDPFGDDYDYGDWFVPPLEGDVNVIPLNPLQCDYD